MKLSTPPQSRGRSALLIKLAVSGVLLAVLFWRVDRAAFVRSLQTLPVPLFLGCVALYALGYLLSTIRWQLLLQAEGIRLPFWRLALVYLQGTFFNLFLPTLIGGDVVRGFFIYRMTHGHDAAIASIMVDRLSGFAAMILIAVGALAFAYGTLNDPQVAVLVLGVAALFTLFMFALVNNRLKDLVAGLLRFAGLGRFEEKLQGLVDALHRYRHHYRALGQAFLLSVLLQVLIIVTFYLIGVGLNLGVPLVYFLVFVPLTTVVAMLPVSVAGLGVREAGAIYFFAKVGVDASAALGMSLVCFSLSLIMSSLGGLAFLFDRHAAKRTAD
ncbi:MAG: lysylphosphatidylglycerol synthase transmembrane domain-containing protein [candidate division NC10 bacterium]